MLQARSGDVSFTDFGTVSFLSICVVSETELVFIL